MGRLFTASARNIWRKSAAHAVEYKGEDFKPGNYDHMDTKRCLKSLSRLRTTLCFARCRKRGGGGGQPAGRPSVRQSRGENDYHVEYGYFLYGLRSQCRIGAKLAQPEREVYSFVGDGSFMMLHSELVTSVQPGKKITVILLDNMTNGCINNLQMEHGMDSYYRVSLHQQESGRQEGGFIPGRFRSHR